MGNGDLGLLSINKGFAVLVTAGRNDCGLLYFLGWSAYKKLVCRKKGSEQAIYAIKTIMIFGL